MRVYASIDLAEIIYSSWHFYSGSRKDIWVFNVRNTSLIRI